jgi:acyl dehydratase
MPLSTKMVGARTEALTHDVDARWLMAYAAGIGDMNPRYLDTQRRTPIAHPVFPVCVEWPVILASRTLPGFDATTAAERARGVHAAHDLHIYRPIRPGDRLTTQATVIDLKAIKPGAAQTTRLDTRDAAGTLVARTYQLGISRGVAVVGEATPMETPPELPHPDEAVGEPREFSIDVPANAAHVYTECARIFNPIHTDRAIALAAGLPDIILHGTATLALVVSRIVDAFLDGDGGRVRRLGGRFTAMVLMPSALRLAVRSARSSTLFFEVATLGGGKAISDGFVCYD